MSVAHGHDLTGAAVKADGAVGLDGKDSYGAVEGGLRDIDFDQAGDVCPGEFVVNFPLEFAAVTDYADALDIVDEPLDFNRAYRLVSQIDIEDVRCGVDAGVGLHVFARNSGAGAVNRLGVFTGPASEFFEYFNFLGRDGSVFSRTDVKEQISAVADAVHNLADAASNIISVDDSVFKMYLRLKGDKAVKKAEAEFDSPYPR